MIDTRIVGLWDGGGPAPWALLRTGQVFRIAPEMPYAITDNDTILRHLSGKPPLTFTRVTGSGTLVGLWTRDQMDEGVLVREDHDFRADGSLAALLWFDGVPQPTLTGFYTDSGSAFIEEVLLGTFTTAPGDVLTVTYDDGSEETGPYSVATGGDDWTWHLPAGDILYTRVPDAP